MKIRNGHAVVYAVALIVGFIFGSCAAGRDARQINAVLSHQVDEQTRLISEIIGVEAADKIRRMSHDLAVERARN